LRLDLAAKVGPSKSIQRAKMMNMTYVYTFFLPTDTVFSLRPRPSHFFPRASRFGSFAVGPGARCCFSSLCWRSPLTFLRWLNGGAGVGLVADLKITKMKASLGRFGSPARQIGLLPAPTRRYFMISHQETCFYLVDIIILT
jgi:hypothetical protein